MRFRILIPLAAAAALAIAGATTVDAQTKGKRHKKHKKSQGVHINLGHWGSFGGPRLGAHVQPLTDDLRKHFGAKPGEGLLVGKVMPGSAAAKAGVKVGDVVVSVDGKSIDDLGDVWSAMRGKKTGDKVKVGVIRNKRRKTLTATIKGITGSPMTKLSHVLKQIDALKDLDVDIDVPDIITQLSKGKVIMSRGGNIHIPDFDIDISGVPSVHRGNLQKKLDAAEKRLKRLEQRLKRLEKQRKSK